jgi:hypothetical protein
MHAIALLTQLLGSWVGISRAEQQQAEPFPQPAAAQSSNAFCATEFPEVRAVSVVMASAADLCAQGCYPASGGSVTSMGTTSRQRAALGAIVMSTAHLYT